MMHQLILYFKIQLLIIRIGLNYENAPKKCTLADNLLLLLSDYPKADVALRRYAYYIKITAYFEMKKYTECINYSKKYLDLFGYDFDVIKRLLLSLNQIAQERDAFEIIEKYNYHLNNDAKNKVDIVSLMASFRQPSSTSSGL